MRMDISMEQPQTKKRKLKDASQVTPSPSKDKKLKVKHFAKVTNFNEAVTIKKEFIEDDNVDSINEKTTLTSDLIKDDDAIWIVQCPLGMNPSSLIGESISFFEPFHVNDSASSNLYDIEPIISPKSIQCILPKEKTGSLEISNLSVSGMLIVTDSVSQKEIEISPEEDEFKESYYQLPDVKQRNPHLPLADLNTVKRKSIKKKSKK